MEDTKLRIRFAADTEESLNNEIDSMIRELQILKEKVNKRLIRKMASKKRKLQHA
jgi:hypothetical protein